MLVMPARCQVEDNMFFDAKDRPSRILASRQA